jgi:hypothetical protein
LGSDAQSTRPLLVGSVDAHGPAALDPAFGSPATLALAPGSLGAQPLPPAPWAALAPAEQAACLGLMARLSLRVLRVQAKRLGGGG